MEKGISRTKLGKKFIYKNASGKVIKQKSLVDQLNKLRIPPAWQNVWISPNRNAKLQATGFDARKRKQYIYHPKFRQKQEDFKFSNITKFAKVLPRIRKAVNKDLNRTNLDLRKVTAAIVALIDETLIRVGNDQYAKENKSYGLTTLKDKHVKFRKDSIEFSFLGKSKQEHSITIKSKKLSVIVKKCRDLAGDELFQYLDPEGKIHDIKSNHVNSYLKEISGNSFTAKDFRTWTGTVLAAMALSEFKKFDTKALAKTYVKKAIESVAKKLGNTPAICRKCYIHPEIIDTYLKSGSLTLLKDKVEQSLKGNLKGFSAFEGVVLAFLQKSLK